MRVKPKILQKTLPRKKTAVNNVLEEAGFVIRTHGVKGALRISLRENIKELSIGEALFLSVRGTQLPFFIAQIEYTGEQEAIILFEEITNKEDASLYRKKTVWCKPEYILAENEEEESSLEGFGIYNELGIFIGKIISVTDMGEYLLAETQTEKTTVTIPLHDDLIKETDDAKKIIRMHIPEGLLDQ